MNLATKALLVAFIEIAAASGVAQGIVNFANGPQTLVSLGGRHGLPQPFASYYGLFLAPAGTTDPALFTFSGLYATNQAAPGRFSGGFGVSVPAWAPGVVKSFFIAGWTTDLGHDWDPAWMNGIFASTGHWGISAIGIGSAGGFDGTGPLPPLNLFGGETGVQSGFILYPVGPIPEPASLSVSVLGIATVALYRRYVKTVWAKVEPRPALDCAMTLKLHAVSPWRAAREAERYPSSHACL